MKELSKRSGEVQNDPIQLDLLKQYMAEEAVVAEKEAKEKALRRSEIKNATKPDPLLEQMSHIEGYTPENEPVKTGDMEEKQQRDDRSTKSEKQDPTDGLGESVKEHHIEQEEPDKPEDVRKGPTDMSQQKTSYYNMMGQLRNRRPFISVKGYVGLGPVDTQAGDLVVIFLGGKFPYILRPNKTGTYALVGEAYVQCVMYGEFMEREADVEEFVLE
ncbi:hypothetical protein EJ08DRAFT_95184 [Tothia fuscella]|uniref:Uncharacterized protein n=1 Tax=Tothia fuscella TaxID=1048955 RepID=A0A9P4NXK0_9PEZI|nr:hypothetical protein EJ08DRAFT_95184 [Tothia fuscella]